jgi:TolA-binding protein
MSRILLLLSLAAAACTAVAAPASEPAFTAHGKASSVAALQRGGADNLQQRLRDLEEKVLQLQQQSQHDQEALEQGRRRQAELEVASHAMPWLLGLVVALAAVAVGLAWRVQSLTRRRQEAWWDTSAPLALDIEAPRDEAPNTAAVVFNEPAAQHDAPTRPPLSAPLATAVLPVDEQLALSQQTALLCALGQDDQAVELLLSRMEQGGRTPWLLLKLLALYQRTGQRAAFDKLARQVAVRFGCVLPAWDAPPQLGLEADPALLLTLQQSWESPVDALQALAKLLLKPQSLPSLAACEDMLLLYRVAHERHRQDVAACDEVDLPLPLALPEDGRSSSPVSPLLPGLRAQLQPAP